MYFIQVWRSTKPCADQRGAKLSAWNTYAKVEQKQAYLPTRNTEEGVYNFFLHKHIPSIMQFTATFHLAGQVRTLCAKRDDCWDSRRKETIRELNNIWILLVQFHPIGYANDHLWCC